MQMVDATRPEFLRAHVDADASAYEVTYAGTNHIIAVVSGPIRGPAAPCRVAARTGCLAGRTIRADARYDLVMEMQVPELAELDVELGPLGLTGGDPALVDLWLDAEFAAAWRALIDEMPTSCELTVQDGTCRLAGDLAADERRRMQLIVDVMIALSTVPARRMRELIAALEAHPARVPAPRLSLDSELAPVVDSPAGRAIVEASQRPGIDQPAPGLRTRIRAERARDGAAGASGPMTGGAARPRGAAGGNRLVIVDRETDRRRRPRFPGPTVPLAAGGRGWLVCAEVWPRDLGAASDALAIARPSVVVADDHEIVVSFPGWMTDPARLAAGLDLVRALGPT